MKLHKSTEDIASTLKTPEEVISLNPRTTEFMNNTLKFIISEIEEKYDGTVLVTYLDNVGKTELKKIKDNITSILSSKGWSIEFRPPLNPVKNEITVPLYISAHKS